MCRFTLYHGPPIRISALVTEPENSLNHQSDKNREREEPWNGDGESLHLHRGRRTICEAGVCRMVEPEFGNGAVLVSSEPPSMDPGWEMIPRNHLVAITQDHSVRFEAL